MESIIGLFLLGLITVTTLPMISSSYAALRKHNIKLEMIYIGEMAIERIKAYNKENGQDLYIYDASVSELIELFNKNKNIEINLGDEPKEKFLIKIIKDEKINSLWILSVYVYHNVERGKINEIQYKAYLPEK